jgi:hypothetical protein
MIPIGFTDCHFPRHIEFDSGLGGDPIARIYPDQSTEPWLNKSWLVKFHNQFIALGEKVLYNRPNLEFESALNIRLSILEIL